MRLLSSHASLQQISINLQQHNISRLQGSTSLRLRCSTSSQVQRLPKMPSRHTLCPVKFEEAKADHAIRLEMT